MPPARYASGLQLSYMKRLEPGSMAPDIFFQIFFCLLQLEVHGSIQDGQTAMVGQRFHHYQGIAREFPLGLAVKSQYTDHFILCIDGGDHHGYDTLFLHGLSEFNALVSGGIIDNDGLAFEGPGRCFRCRFNPYFDEFFTQAAAGNPFQRS